jgi:tRNA dimethylallyltransferase
MHGVFFFVGPTAVGKSAVAVDVAEQNDAEIVSADAFQLYRGLEILTASPDEELRRVPHHLIGVTPIHEIMSAAKFRELALRALADIQSRGKNAIVVGGSGLYLKALMDGFTETAPPNFALREKLSALSASELAERLRRIDPKRAAKVDVKNPRRVIRALEIASARRVIPSEAEGSRSPSLRVAQRDPSTPLRSAQDDSVHGVLLVRDRDDLYGRINERVNATFGAGVREEVRRATNVGSTAARALGYAEIAQLNAGAISEADAIARIQQATRRYAKRQLTWFRHQTNFPQLNLTALSHREAISAISQLTQRHFAQE